VSSQAGPVAAWLADREVFGEINGSVDILFEMDNQRDNLAVNMHGSGCKFYAY
jgi:hypothetical protein